MPNDKESGVYCNKDQTFYYMEYGNSSLAYSSVEKILKTLTIRGLVDIRTGVNPIDPKMTHEVFTIREAKEKNLEMKPIYASENIKKAFESQQKEKSKGWGKSNAKRTGKRK